MSKADLSLKIAGVEFKNPVTTASGTFASGKEYAEFVDLNRLGAITVKGVSAKPWRGNPPPRIAEVYGGMLNSVGLQNKGVESFLREDLPFLRRFDTKIIVNVCGHSLEEYAEVIAALQNADIDMLELNISCPNLDNGGLSFGTDPETVKRVVGLAKKAARQPLIVKLSPNVTDIVAIAGAARDAGADALSLINTLLGMKIDIHSKKPVLARSVGGLSGPAIKPIAVRMVYEVARSVNIPIIGMGGIQNFEDAVEFMLAGASMVAVGTANFTNPRATIEVLEGLEEYFGGDGRSLAELRSSPPWL